MENRRKSEENEMQLKAGQKAWKISKTKISQTVRKPVSQCENFANQFRNAKISQTKIRSAKISQCEISKCQSQIRNAKISQSQFRSAKFNFAMPKHYSFVPTYAKFRIAKFTTTLRNFANPFRIAKFTLRNFQALSSFVINAEPPSIFGVLLF